MPSAFDPGKSGLISPPPARAPARGHPQDTRTEDSRLWISRRCVRGSMSRRRIPTALTITELGARQIGIVQSLISDFAPQSNLCSRSKYAAHRAVTRRQCSVGDASSDPQHFLYFLPLPQGHGSFLPILGSARTNGTTLLARSGVAGSSFSYWLQ